MQDQQAELDWKAGTIPISRRFDDPYFSLDNGLEETRHVFLAGNGLPGRFGGQFHIAELGFGTGLNCLVTLKAWQEAAACGNVDFTTFEAFPMAASDMAKALAAFPELAELTGSFLNTIAVGPGPYQLAKGFTLTVIRGDARITLPAWGQQADAFFLDGFSPAKNPEMWGPDLMTAVADRLKPSGTLATYTAAGHVRRSLAAAGLEVTRAQGYGRKRHMTTARKPL